MKQKLKLQEKRYYIWAGSPRTAVKCLEGTAWIAYVQFISGSLLKEKLEADGTVWSTTDFEVVPEKEAGNMWLEGSDRYIGAYKTAEEAEAALDAYMENY